MENNASYLVDILFEMYHGYVRMLSLIENGLQSCSFSASINHYLSEVFILFVEISIFHPFLQTSFISTMIPQIISKAIILHRATIPEINVPAAFDGA